MANDIEGVAGAPHFSRKELCCPCAFCSTATTTALPSFELRVALEGMRLQFGKPLVVKSGVRCAAHNADIGGAERSRHVPANGGDAVDIACADPYDRYRLVQLAIRFQVKFIEVCPGHLHFDMRPGGPMLVTGGDK